LSERAKHLLDSANVGEPEEGRRGFAERAGGRIIVGDPSS